MYMCSFVNCTLAGLNDFADWSQPTNLSVGKKFNIVTTALVQKMSTSEKLWIGNLAQATNS